MSASDELREVLDANGIEYSILGNMTIVPAEDGFTWNFRDMYNGCLTASISQQIFPKTVTRLLRVTAKESRCDENGVGRSWCVRCGKTVERSSRYCSECGSRFING